MRNLPCFLALLVALFVGAFDLAAVAAEPGHVLVSISPQKHFVESIAGGGLEIAVLVKPGADPHSYEPSPAQMIAASEASLYFTAGISLEQAWVPRLTQVARNIRVVDLAPGEEHGQDHDLLHMEAGHAWLSPTHVKKTLPVITEALCAEFPLRAAMFKDNAADFKRKIEQLDQQIRDLLKNVPQNRRSFMTFHPAWKNFAEDYGLSEIAIETNGKEPGPKRMAELIELARDKNIKIILVEPQFSRKTAEAIAQSVPAVLVEADPLAENWDVNLLRVAKSLSVGL